ncbi:hypothetical protein INN71_02765 [Nocardioides sp. ChNu-153]|uniref:hypothetical protein n=1 Tax=Nocardioides sp. ChNu-153 TaxID=2779364 RepID=UPI00265703C2|nr:hypothetical protein [Nocardioides sp. ChNu-153]MDN7120308.1 hypothetical protein [Nocardioides sp. ChNu-153]
MSANEPASREDIEVLMVHLSLLAEWRMRKVGNALGSGAVAGVIAALVLAAVEGPVLLALLIAVAATAAVLFYASAPVPLDDETPGAA